MGSFDRLGPMNSSNPAFRSDTFQLLGSSVGDRMTVRGTVNKSFVLIGLLLFTAVYSWQQLMQGIGQGWNGQPQLNMPSWYWPALIGTFILSLVIIFKKNMAPYLAPVYALGQGLLLGTISAFFELRYPGIAFQAVLGTGGTFLAMLTAYRLGWIEVNEKFKSIMMVAMGGIFLTYMLSFILSLFGTQIPMIHGSGIVGIGFSVVVVGVAAFSLLLDFDFIERGSQSGAPKYMEWYGAFGLLITLVWLYLEILRLLSKLNNRR